MIGGRFGELLAAAQRGDEGAFTVLWRDANPALVRYLRVIVAAEAEDVAAETWTSVIRGFRTFRGDEDGWRCYLFAIARRRAIDHTRYRSRRPESLVGEPTSIWDAIGGDVADEALQNLDTRRALRLVASLPPLQAEVLMLRVVAGLDVNAVARIVGKSPGAVRVAAHRALKALARTLEPAM
jgi:RNA polymerase sigma-70 factor (ECF subfamily)